MQSCAAAIVSGRHPNIGRKPSPRRRSDRKVGRSISFRTIKKSGRCPTRFRRDQTRQQVPQDAILRGSKYHRMQSCAAANVSGRRPNIGRKPSPRRRSDRKVGHSISIRTIKKSGRCPTRFRRDQTRQQVSAGTARRPRHSDFYARAFVGTAFNLYAVF